MEGGIHPADASSFKECVSLAWRNPYVLRMALSAGIGGLLFGYDTGVISGALLYIRDDFRSVDKSSVLQESIVSTAIAGAILGAAVGGWINDRFGRRFALLLADALFFIGSVLMAAAPNPTVIIIGRVFVGFGVGMASMAAPLYISEASPANIRGALVTTNGFLITAGQFLSYCINLAFTSAPGTWRWMLGIAGLPAVLQFIMMIYLPESPRWLYRKGREEEAKAILEKIYPAEDVGFEIASLKESVETEIEETKGSKASCSELLRTKTVRRGLIAGVGIIVLQQFVGINTVMYYSATIIQYAGFAKNQTALLLSLVTSGLNAFGSIISIYFVDRTGRRKLLVFSLLGVICSLGLLTGVFRVASNNSPAVLSVEQTSTKFPAGYTCPSYASTGGLWTCTACLNAECGFCSAPHHKMGVGTCLVSNETISHVCEKGGSEFYSRGCPSNYGWLALTGLALYIICFSPGMGTVPWTLNSEIYPLRYRGVCGGIAATGCWVSNLIVAQSFLSITKEIGASWTFFIYGVISVLALFFVLIFVPETKGMRMEDIEKMLDQRVLQFRFWGKKSADKN